jgi:co-chaperonin GroES (HSP10)
MTFRVRNDLLLVRPHAQPTTSAGGLSLIYDRQQSTMRGEVIALGQGRYTRTGKKLPHVCRVGDAIIFSPDSGSELIFEQTTLIALREQDVLAVIEENGDGRRHQYD